MTERSIVRLVWSIEATIAAILVATLVFLVLGLDTPPPQATFGFRGWAVVLSLALATAGGVIATRVPGNPVGWLLLVVAAGAGLQELAQQYTIYGAYDSPGTVPGVAFAAWVVEWVWIPFMGLAAIIVPLLFPTGRLPSRRWSSVVWIGAIGGLIGTVSFALEPGELESSPGLRNPLGAEGATWLIPVGNAAMGLFAVALCGAILSVVIRYRRSEGDERQQLRWLSLGLGILGCAFLLGVPAWTLGGEGPQQGVLENLVVAGLVAIPVSIGIAISRYRLYDIDLVIKKTVVYVVLAILLFVVGVVPAWASAGAVFRLTGESEISWGLAGLVVGVAVWPLRRLATRIADRVVFGRRATPYEILSEFAGRVAETYAAEDVLQRMAQVLGEAVGAETATVWLGAADRARPVATWPSDAAPDRTLPASAIEVRHVGTPLGALSVRMSPRDPMTPVKERLIRDLAGQAGLVLRNANLIEDLKASRQRLVTAQNEERRRIERNIHDGAQQQLVALAVKLKLADSTVGRDDERARSMLAELQAETNQALEDLRDLARGIYPPLLADKGLGSALESQARKSPVPVELETDGIGRYAEETEAAVYFSILESLQNVAKYAEASRATVRLAQANRILTFEVSDDGIGFDPEAASHGSGLQGIADRLAALGGELIVRSAPGDGTTVAGRLPVEDAP